MKILVLSNKVPFPARDGSSIATANLLQGLIETGADISLLSFNTTKHYQPPQRAVSAKPAGLKMHLIPLDNRITAFRALANLAGRQPFQVSRFVSAAFRQKLTQLLREEDFDLIQLEGLSMAVYLPFLRQHSQKPVSLRAHNVESRIWQRHAANEKNPFMRHYLHLQSRRLARFEREVLEACDAVVAITPADLEIMRQITALPPQLALPCGVDLARYAKCDNTDFEYDIVSLASYDWLPNRQGMEWFVSEVWPLILAERPATRLAIGGHHQPRHWSGWADAHLHLLPEVPEMRPFIASGQLVVVPLLAGSGMRIKILENMALGKCQVTTSIGAEGIAVQSGRELQLADSPAEMARSILHLLEHPEEIAQMGRAARQTAEQYYDHRNLARQLLAFYKSEVV